MKNGKKESAILCFAKLMIMNNYSRKAPKLEMQISHYLSAYDMLHVLAPYVIEVLTAPYRENSKSY